MSRRGRFAILTVAIVICPAWLPSSTAEAMVIPPKLAELAQSSEVIVVAKVVSIRGIPVVGHRWAKARVTEVWKGPSLTMVEYLISSNSACDISDAEPGESVLLFLTASGRNGRSIAWEGRGRMPLRPLRGETYASYFTDVQFPAGTPEIDCGEGKGDGYGRAVELGVVRNLVKKAADGKK